MTQIHISKKDFWGFNLICLSSPIPSPFAAITNKGKHLAMSLLQRQAHSPKRCFFHKLSTPICLLLHPPVNPSSLGDSYHFFLKSRDFVECVAVHFPHCVSATHTSSRLFSQPHSIPEEIAHMMSLQTLQRGIDFTG